MRTLYPTIAGLLFSICSIAQTLPHWNWARNIVQGQHTGVQIASDPFGNVFVLGSCDHNAQPSVMNDSGVYLARYDRYGQFSWARKITGSPQTLCSSPAGEVYVAGTLQNYSSTSSSSASTEAFLDKYDAAGNSVWSKKYTGPYACINAMTVAPSGNIYVTGRALQGLQMDGHILLSDLPFFVAKVNSGGSTQWIRGTEIIPDTSHSKNIVQGFFITADASEKLYVEYNAVNCPNWSCDTRYLLKLDQNGDYYFHKHYEDYSGHCHGLLVEPGGDLIIGHNTDVGTSSGAVVLRRWDSTMTTKKWEIQTGSWQCQNLLMSVGPVSDLKGYAYMGGSVGAQCWWGEKDSVQFGPVTVYTDSLSDIVIVKIDKQTGNYADVFHIPGRLYDGVCSMSSDGLGNCYVAGFFNHFNDKDASHLNDTICFDNDCLIGSAGNTPIFLAKLQISDKDYTDNVSVQEMRKPRLILTPNPSSGLFHLQGLSEPDWEVRDLRGRLVASDKGNQIDISVNPPGIYIVAVNTEEGILRSKIVKSDQ